MDCPSVFRWVRVNELVFFVAALFFLTLASCGKRASQATDGQIQADGPPGGRPETKTLQAAGLVGYDGKRLQKSVDKILDAQDQRNKKLEDDLRKADDQ